jgi:site-specific DNA-methyltransferase (adenine-specific)
LRLYYHDDRVQVWNGDARDLSIVDDESAGLVLTSPPWWNGGDYRHKDQIGFGQTYEEFHDSIRRVGQECLRCLLPGCAMILWMADLYREGGSVPLAADTHRPLQQAGFVYESTYYWYAWPRIPLPSPETCVPMTARPLHQAQVLIIYRKPGVRPPPPPEIVKASRIDPEEYRDSLQAVWTPGPLIDEPYGRLIRLWSYVDDIVLEPFAGEGAAVPVLAKQLGRRCIAVELNESICLQTVARVSEAKAPA